MHPPSVNQPLSKWPQGTCKFKVKTLTFLHHNQFCIVTLVTSDSTSVTRYPAADTLFTSSELNITCVTTVNQAVDTPVQVTHQWEGPGGVVSTDNETDVSSVTSSGQDYSSTVFFSSLRSSHSGTYTCSSTVSTVEASVFIPTSAVQTASTSFDAS